MTTAATHALRIAIHAGQKHYPPNRRPARPHPPLKPEEPAFAVSAETRATDDALDLFCQLLRGLTARVERRGRLERLETLGELDAAALRLREAVAVLLDPDVPDDQVRASVFSRVERAALAAAVVDCDRLTRPSGDHSEAELLSRYSMVRQFLSAMLATVSFEAGPAGQPTLEALAALRGLEGRKKVSVDEVPTGFARPAWQRLLRTAASTRTSRLLYERAGSQTPRLEVTVQSAWTTNLQLLAATAERAELLQLGGRPAVALTVRPGKKTPDTYVVLWDDATLVTSKAKGSATRNCALLPPTSSPSTPLSSPQAPTRPPAIASVCAASNQASQPARRCSRRRATPPGPPPQGGTKSEDQGGANPG